MIPTKDSEISDATRAAIVGRKPRGAMASLAAPPTSGNLARGGNIAGTDALPASVADGPPGPATTRINDRPADLVAWFLQGADLSDEGDFRRASTYLRQAYGWWASLGDSAPCDAEQVAAEYQLNLLKLWKAEHDPLTAVEALPLEAKALRAVRQKATTDATPYILYNSACLRTLMVRAGALDPIEGIPAIELLGLVFDTAGDNTETFADGILTDPDLDGLRGLPSYRSLAARASAYLNRLAEAAKSRGK